MKYAGSMLIGDMKVEGINKTLQSNGMFIQGHTDVITEIILSPDENFAISASKDSTIRVWNLRSLLQESILEGHQGSVNTIGINSEGSVIVSGGEDHQIIIWDFRNRTKTESLSLSSASVLHILVTKDDKYIISLTGSALIVWNIAERAETWNIGFTSNFSIDLFTLSLDSSLLVTTNNCDLRFWHFPKQNEILKCSQKKRITAIVLTNDNTYAIFCVKKSCLVFLWSIKKNCIELTLKGSSIYTDKLIMSDDNKSFITTYKKKAYFTIWNLERKQQQALIDLGCGWIQSLALIRGGGSIVLGHCLGFKNKVQNIKIFNLNTLNFDGNFPGHCGTLTATFLAHEILVTAANDKSIRLWDLTKQSEIAVIDCSGSNFSSPSSLSLSNNKKFVVSSHMSEKVTKVWKVEKIDGF